MPIAAAVIPAVIGAGGAIAGGAMASGAASDAANTQANAAMYSANLQKQAADQSLAFQKNVFNTQQQELAPWLSTGTAADANLAYLMGLPVSGNATIPGAATTAVPRGNAPGSNIRISGPVRLGGNPGLPGYRSPMLGGREMPLERGGINPISAAPTNTNGIPTHQVSMQSLINPALGPKGLLAQPFQAPTLAQAQQEPGYQFALQQGEDAIQRSAAARGGLVTGGTAKALNDYANQFAEGNYQNVYNRAFNTFETNQTNLYNRLAALSGTGQTTANLLGNYGSNAANLASQTLMNSAYGQGQAYQNAAAARASGYGANASIWGNAMNSGLASLASLFQPGGYFAPTPAGVQQQYDPNQPLYTPQGVVYGNQ